MSTLLHILECFAGLIVIANVIGYAWLYINAGGIFASEDSKDYESHRALREERRAFVSTLCMALLGGVVSAAVLFTLLMK